MQEMIPVEAARAAVLDAVRPGPSVRVPLAEALGRTLADEAVGRAPVPPFDNAGMDGFAVRTADLAALPAVLYIGEDIPAGRAPERMVTPGMCARIMTGAPMPDGADAVVPVEWTDAAGEGRVRIERAPAPGSYVRRAGQDIAPGDRLLAAGTLVTPPVVGLLAALGYGTVRVRSAPRVAVVTTGDELVGPDEQVGPGRIRDVNGPALAAQVRAAGGVPDGPYHAPDDPDAVRRAIEAAREADVLVVSGGVSVGRYDYVKDALDAAGFALHFWRVRQRPGKPLAFGLLGGRPVFGLPGNPVSSAVCFEQYVRPALARMLGRVEAAAPIHAVLEAPIEKGAGLYHFVRGVLRTGDDGRLYVRDTGPQASNLYTSMVRADALIHLPEALEDPPAGTVVRVERLGW